MVVVGRGVRQSRKRAVAPGAYGVGVMMPLFFVE